MKTDRGSFRMLERKQLLQERIHDAYKIRRQLPEPTLCSGCGAVYRRGRWRWGASPRGAHAALCPACHRIRDRLPAGYVTLQGRFFGQHRDEVLACVRHCEEAEKAMHPMDRIMAIAAKREGTVVTTTDSHLARRIGHALRGAFKGELESRYNKEDNLLRVTWRR
jgi:NMD protein affecting ribosome stability and mRNA decay